MPNLKSRTRCFQREKNRVKIIFLSFLLDRRKYVYINNPVEGEANGVTRDGNKQHLVLTSGGVFSASWLGLLNISQRICNYSCWLSSHRAQIFPVLDKQQLVVISTQAHLAAQLQSLEASLHGNEAEGLVGGKRVTRRRLKNYKSTRYPNSISILPFL